MHHSSQRLLSRLYYASQLHLWSIYGYVCILRHNLYSSQFANILGCRRIEQWVDYDLNSSDPLVSNYHRIIRQCAYFGDLKKPCQKDNNIGGRQHVCYCQGVACNESDKKLVIDEVMLATFVIGNTVVLPIILSFKKVFS